MNPKRSRNGAGRCAAVLTILGLAATAAGGPFNYDKYAAVLKEYVNDKGQVNYRKLQANRKTLDEFVNALAAVDPKDYAKWSDKEKIAFWINAYNGLTLQAIIDNYPIKARGVSSLLYPNNSIRQIDGVWEETKHRVAGEAVTLSQIENKKLRAAFDAPGVHMALVCASVGCPYLRTEPYRGDRLDAQLAEQARRFLKDSEKFRIDLASRKVYLSPIFKWYDDDYVKSYGTDTGFRGHGRKYRAVLNYIANHVDDRTANFLRRQRYGIAWLDYDWSLNEQ